MKFLITTLSFCIFPIIILSESLFISVGIILLSFFLLDIFSSYSSLNYRISLLLFHCSCIPVLMHLSYRVQFSNARSLQMGLIFLAICFLLKGSR
ncbi:MAG: hypothetical protein ACRDCW_03375, partial [Sarcina sp.]